MTSCQEITLPTSPDWWARHLMQMHPEKPWMNSFTRWRVSALEPVRRYWPKPQITKTPTKAKRKKVKADE